MTATLQLGQIGLQALIESVRWLKIRSIAVPPLGCGNGGLAWSRVAPMIEAAFAQVPDVRVLVFEPPAAEFKKGYCQLNPGQEIKYRIPSYLPVLSMYSRHRFPAEIISYCVWLYYTFALSYRDIEKMMLYRGVEVTYETIREWCRKFGQQYANQVRRKRPYLTDKWHLDEVVITIKGQQYYLWRAVDSEGNVLDILMQQHRDTQAAKRFFLKLLKQQGFVPRVIVTDKLKSYQAAKNQMLKSVEHRQHKGLNNRAENSHQPTRVRERRMRKFKSPGQAQRFLATFGPIRDHFHPKQHQLTAQRYREQMRQRFQDWQEIVGLKPTA